MKNFNEIYRTLRRQNRKNYYLLSGCCFFSVLLITAYVSMMRSPTVLNVLPEGGDSRKQVMIIFVLAVIGCGVFTTYASALFFRSKSKETGVFLALGASRSLLRHELMRELAFILMVSCGFGAVLGTPFAWLIWQAFRAFLVDTAEMSLTFTVTAYLFALAFSVFVILATFLMGARFIKRTNIIDIINEARTSEPIHEVKPWYGKVGILLIVLGGFLGYRLPSFFILVVHWYPPEILDLILYAPLFIGIYMVLLHTVVNGWGGKKHRYKHIISTSMMKFQGRQTVRNMLVITVLIAGAYFAVFYTPILTTGAMLQYKERPVDYSYHYRINQAVPTKDDVQALANEEGISITSWAETEQASLATDGMEHVETTGTLGTTYEKVYNPMVSEEYFISESGYQALTGASLDVSPGGVVPILDSEGSDCGRMRTNITVVTNPVTRETLPITVQETANHDMLFAHYVLDDGDYDSITAGLTPEWQETQVFFNVENVDETYFFAKRLFNDIVDGFDESCEIGSFYDRIKKMNADEAGKPYWGDTEGTKLSYEARNSSDFRLYWQYMPAFRVLDQHDFVQTTAVYLMLFIFIAIICFAAVIVISYTRCLTIALHNQRVYDDLRRLGTSRAYLYKAVKGQLSRVWGTPTGIGTVIIFLFYTMIMYFNDEGRFSSGELAGLGVCLALIALLSTVIYGFYRLSLKKVCKTLAITK